MRAFLVAQSDRIGVTRTARNLGVSRRTVYRWRRRAPDFADHSCRPLRSPRRSSEELEAAVIALRMERHWGPDRIGPTLGLPASTVHRILRRRGAHRLAHLFPKPQRSFGRFAPLAPGELIAVDIKPLGSIERGGGRRHHGEGPRGPNVGWRQLHVAIDLASRLVYTELRPSIGNLDTISFLAQAVAFFDAHGIQVRRVLSDNGAGYKRRFREATVASGLRHTRTQPYHPWTNGRVERFIGTIQQECLYAMTLHSDEERALAIALFVAYYNGERPHTAIEGLSPLGWLRRRGVTRSMETSARAS